MSTHDSKARENISSFYKPVDMPGGFEFDHAKTLKRIEAYYQSKFLSGDRDSQGFRKYFFQIIKPAIDGILKFLDLDTKDVQVTSEHPGQELQVHTLKHDLQFWMKDNKFGQLLNAITSQLPKYGSVFLKKSPMFSDLGWGLANIHNLRYDPSVEELSDSDFVYERHTFNRRQLNKMKSKWDSQAVQKLLDDHPNQDNFAVWEMYDKKPDGNKRWKMRIKAGLFTTRDDDGNLHKAPEKKLSESEIEEGEFIPSRVLFEADRDRIPYRDHHLENLPGRLLGLGFVEYLFEEQIRANELANLKVKSLYWTALKIFQTRDDTVADNVLEMMKNGDVLKVNDEISQIPIDERNLSFFETEDQKWQNNANQKTFNFDAVRGETLPSRTPLGVANLSVNMSSSFYDKKRERLGLFLKDWILNEVIPSFRGENKKNHRLKLSGSESELRKLHEMIVDRKVKEAVNDFIEETGFSPDQQRIEEERQNALEELENERFFEIPEGFYENAKFTIDIMITGEQMETSQRIQSLTVALQTLTNNPGILQNKGMRTIFFKLLELAGIDVADMNLTQSDMEDTEVQQGGSVSVRGQQFPELQQVERQV